MGRKISEESIADSLAGDELIPFAKNGANGAVTPDTIKEFAQDGLDDKYVGIEGGKGLSSNDFTNEDKSKLDGIENGAQVNPTKVSQLQNDAKYQTETQVENRVTILSEVWDAQLVDAFDNLDNKKVDKVTGKQLSTEDFTTTLLNKLNGLSNYDDSDILAKYNTLNSTLNTILGHDDATAAIDRFYEIENFLQGITNTQTLTGLLQEMKSEIVQLCADTYIAKPTNGTSSQFLKADGSVDGTNYLPTSGGTIENTNVPLCIKRLGNETNSVIKYSNDSGDLGYIGVTSGAKINPYQPYFQRDNDIYTLWHSGNDGSGSGLDADLLDGVEGVNYLRKDVNNIKNDEITVAAINATNDSANNYISHYNLALSNNNNGLFFYVGGFINERVAMIQSGHNHTSHANATGVLHLNKLGGNVYINNKLAATIDSNVASADKLTTKQLTNEDLNNVKAVNSFISYYALGDNTCANKPTGVGYFALQVFRRGGDNDFVQILSTYTDTYRRTSNGNAWSSWKKMLTEDDLTALAARVTALENK